MLASSGITKEELLAMILNDYVPPNNGPGEESHLNGSPSFSKISRGGNESFVFDD
jgi:hypothetical protein